ncbi:hypothetical protein HanXRQr2_Chr03g0120451 [Helianthus annuus]|uniref:Uncharacterized protein n=1 Tax=Helianthus annuus TaxID=4232 RepID=A0A9K3JGX1_HELAN|nr:hypothetical protein HanXRQr2_Chr03g0120451 [Helianthus annuus]
MFIYCFATYIIIAIFSYNRVKRPDSPCGLIFFTFGPQLFKITSIVSNFSIFVPG